MALGEQNLPVSSNADTRFIPIEESALPKTSRLAAAADMAINASTSLLPISCVIHCFTTLQKQGEAVAHQGEIVRSGTSLQDILPSPILIRDLKAVLDLSAARPWRIDRALDQTLKLDLPFITKVIWCTHIPVCFGVRGATRFRRKLDKYSEARRSMISHEAYMKC